MRIVVICSNSFAAQIALRDLWKAYGTEVVGVVTVSQLRGSPTEQMGKCIKLLRTSSWPFLFLKMMEVFVYPSALKMRSYLYRNLPPEQRFPLSSFLRRKGIPVIRSSHVNDARTKEHIRRWKPDLIVSAYGTQIFDPELIRLASCVINVHGGPLPGYRGSAPYFWLLHNQEPQLGITVHLVSAELDTGEILVTRSIDTPLDCSVYRAHYLLCRMAGEALVEAITSIRESRMEKKPQSGSGHRYRIPTRSEGVLFKGKWFTLRDVLGLW